MLFTSSNSLELSAALAEGHHLHGFLDDSVRASASEERSSWVPRIMVSHPEIRDLRFNGQGRLNSCLGSKRRFRNQDRFASDWLFFMDSFILDSKARYFLIALKELVFACSMITIAYIL